MEVYLFSFRFPLSTRKGADILRRQCEVAGDAHHCLRLQRCCQRFEHLVVAVGCLDEYLRLMFSVQTLLKAANGGGTLRLVDRQVADEGEALSVES